MVVCTFLLLLAPDPVGDFVTAANKLSRVSFQYERILNYPASKYHHELKAKVYAEFGAQFTPLGARFQGSGKDWSQVYNGSELFLRSSDKAKDWTANHPKPAAFSSTSCLKNSFFGLVATIGKLKSDAPEAIRPIDATSFEIHPKRRELGPCGLEQAEYDPEYVIHLDVQNHLPLKIVQRLADRADTITTRFSDWVLNPPAPSDGSWLRK